MNIPRMFASVTQYLLEAVMRIFSPGDDTFPLIGFQPFTGDPYKKSAANSW
jgi:hypothetical protein